MSINNIFAASTSTNVGGITRALPGTAELTTLSYNLADSIITTMDKDIEQYQERIERSMKDSNEMDKLINDLASYSENDVSFLMDLDEERLESMLRSQQSKRSRLKNKQMTMDNYKNLLTAACAEHILRVVTGKEKNTRRARAGLLQTDFTEEQLGFLANNQDELKKAIRNVQSKKSIMKSKEGFDENSERWVALLKLENTLKNLRVGGSNPQVIEVDRTREAIVEVFGEFTTDDITSVKLAKAREMLQSIYTAVYGSKEPVDATVVEE